MSLMMVPSLEPGERSLPAELRTRRGEGFARRRMANQLVPVSANGRKVGWGFSGLGAAGDCLEFDQDGVCTQYDTGSSGIDTTQTLNQLQQQNSEALLNSVLAQNPEALTPVQQSQIAQAVQSQAAAPAGWTGPKILAPSVAAPAAPSGYQWAQVVGASGQTLAQVLAVAQGGSTVTLPNGAKMIYGSPTSAAAGSGLFSSGNVFGSANLGNMLPLLLILGVGFLVLGNRGR